MAKGNSGGKPGRSGVVSTPEARARRMAAAAAGGAANAARHIANSIGGGSAADAAGFIIRRQKAQMAKAAIQAQLLKLQLDEKRGLLRPVSQTDATLGRVAAVLRRVIRTAPSLADGLGLPAEDAQRLREAIRTVANQLVIAMAKELEQVSKDVAQMEAAATAPLPDPTGNGDDA